MKKKFYDAISSTDEKALYVLNAVMVVVLSVSYAMLCGFDVS